MTYPIPYACYCGVLVVLAGLWATGLPVLAQQAADKGDPIPPPRVTYKGRTIAQTMHFSGAEWLTRESRQREEDCTTMLRQLGIQPGWTVCDMGCGNGFYTVQLARQVGPGGNVLAVDIQPEMLRMMEARAAEHQLDNIQAVLGTPIDPRLPEGQVDLILCVDVYHEFSHPEHMLAAMRRALKPDGVVALVEFRAEDPEVPIKPLHKMSKEQILAEWIPNDFRLVREFDGLPWQHLMFFGRAEGGERDARCAMRDARCGMRDARYGMRGVSGGQRRARPGSEWPQTGSPGRRAPGTE